MTAAAAWAWVFNPPAKTDAGGFENERYMAQKNMALHLRGRRHFGHNGLPNPAKCVRCARALERLRAALAQDGETFDTMQANHAKVHP